MIERIQEKLTGIRASLAAAKTAEEYWQMVREGFSIAGGIYLNTGTCGPSPKVVYQAVVDHMAAVETMFAEPVFDAATLKGTIAGFINAKGNEIAITRNTTEGMSIVANGLPIKAGDKVLLTDHEHEGGYCCWELAAERRGAVLHRAVIPMDATDELVLGRIKESLTPDTRVVSVSHINYTTGRIMPVKEICAIAHQNGSYAVIDGAHGPGMIAVDVKDLDCDFYAATGHKWLCGPKGTGLLYVSEQGQKELWPTIVNKGWDDDSLGAGRYESVGLVNRSLKVGLLAAVLYQETIGKDNIENRVRELASYAMARLSEINGITVYSNGSSGSGCFAFACDQLPSQVVYARLLEQHFRVRTIDDRNLLRVSTHIFNTMGELDALASAMYGIIEGG